MSGIDGPVEKERLLPGVLGADEVKRFLERTKTTHSSPAARLSALEQLEEGRAGRFLKSFTRVRITCKYIRVKLASPVLRSICMSS